MPAVAKLDKVRNGLKCIYWGVLVYVIAAVLARLVTGFRFDEPIIDDIIRGLQIFALGLVIAGQFSCTKVPSNMPGMGLVWGALVCEIIVLAATSVLFFVKLPQTRTGLAIALMLIPMLAALFITGDILFNVFLQRLAEYVDDKQSASRASGLLILKIIVLGMIVLAIALTFASLGAVSVVIVLMVIAMLLSALVLFQYLALLSGLQYSLLGASRHRPKRTTEEDEEQDLDDMFKGFEGEQVKSRKP